MRGTTCKMGEVLVTLGSCNQGVIVCLGGELLAGDHGDDGQAGESVLIAGLGEVVALKSS